jgi:ABC-2 type transport system permease protein
MNTTTTTTTAAPSRPARTSGVDHATAGGDLGRLVGRALRRQGRRLDALFVNLALPVGIMVVFVYVFGGAITTGASGLNYIDFVVPAVLLLSAGYGAALAAANVAEDLHGGMIDRLRTLPIGSWVVPTSHVIASVVRNTVTAVLALTAALALGFRPDATVLDWALVLALVSGYVLAVSAIAVVWGLAVNSTQAAEAFSFIVLFLPYLSDGFVPAQTMPSVLRSFAVHQPITPLVATGRALLLDQPIGNAGWIAAAWLAAAVVLSVPTAAVLFRRRTT